MDGRSVHYDLPIDWYTLRRWVLEKRMEQVWEIDGEGAYEKMRWTVGRASQPLMPSQFFLSHVGPRTETQWSGVGLWLQPLVLSQECPPCGRLVPLWFCLETA